MSAVRSRGEDRWDIRWPLVGNVALLLGSIAAYSLGVGANHFLQAFSVLLVAAAASSTVGALLGFIFGIPRRVGDQPTGGQAGDLGLSGSIASADGAARVAQQDLSSAGRYVTNSNLAQVSDWLTKVLIGAGLVQLAELPGALRAAGDFLAGSMRGSGAPAFAAGLILYGLASGFILMFLWTTLTARRLYESVEDRIDRQRAQIKAELSSLPEAEDAEAQGRRLDSSAARQVGRVAEAVEAFAQKYGPEHFAPRDYQRLAGQLESVARYREAFEMQLHAAEADPSNPDPLVNAGAIASTFLRDYDTADRLYARALEIKPFYGPALYNLACNAARKGNVGEALMWLERAIGQNPIFARTAIADSRDPNGPFVSLRDNNTFRRLTAAYAEASS